MKYFVFVNFYRQRTEPLFAEFDDYQDAFNFYCKFQADENVWDCRLVYGTDLSLSGIKINGVQI